MSTFPKGHFYSPIVDPEYLRSKQSQLWPSQTPEILSVDFNVENQKEFMRNDFKNLILNFTYPEEAEKGADANVYFQKNGQFGGLDARALYVMLLKYQPKKMVEVGSGFSSLLTADVNQNLLGGSIDFTCIEPYPREFLKKVSGINKLIISKVEEADPATFLALEDGDILFIDSSHVSKTGSDVNYVYFELIPRLKPGVIIHIHDIFFPFDYPKKWVLEENRSWNEQYLLRALLMYNDCFEVLFGSAYAFYVFPELVKAACGGNLFGGGSFWFRKVG